jgi:poly(A) polymerase
VPDPIRRLAALIETDARGADAIADRFRMSNEHRRRLAAMMNPDDPISPGVEPRLIRRALRHLGSAAVRDLALLNWAGELAAVGRLSYSRTEGWIAIIEAADAWTLTTFPLRGRDALALGVEPGPRVGELLRAVEAWWEDNDYRPDRLACSEKLQALIETSA